MTHVALALAAGGAAVFASAGLEKTRDRGPLTTTLAALGSGKRLGAVLVTSLAFAEVSVAVLFIVGAYTAMSAVVVILALLFSAAGLWATLTRVNVKCACLGNLTQSNLGRDQIMALPLWLAVAWAATNVGSTSLSERLTGFLVVMQVLMSLAAARVLPAFLTARADRRVMSGTASVDPQP